MNPELVAQIFEICIIPLLAILTRYFVKFIETKEQEIKAKTDNEIAKKYTERISNTIISCVKTTNQTFVDSLKKQNAFDEEAQKQAFQQTLDAVRMTLGKDAINYIQSISEDVNIYLKQQIESAIPSVKNEK